MEHVPDYNARLRAVAQLGRRFTGGFNDSGLGLFGSIYLQTDWQKNSGRDALPIWNLVNESLTLLPYECYRQYEVGPGLVTESSNTAAQAWVEYFRAADRVAALRAAS